MMTGVKQLIMGGLVLLVVAIGFVWWREVYSSSTADTRGRTEQREKTVADGDYRIEAYERFYDMCAAVQTNEGRVSVLEDELAGDPSQSRKDQINASLTALRATRLQAIHEYNAEARKTDTVANFRASDLPAELDPEEETTTCTAD